MRIVGVDLSAEPRKTAVAVLRSVDARATALESVALGATDADILEAATSADRIAVDCPFGLA